MIVPYWKAGLLASYVQATYGIPFFEICKALGPPSCLNRGSVGNSQVPVYEMSYIFVSREDAETAYGFCRFDLRVHRESGYEVYLKRYGPVSANNEEHLDEGKWSVGVKNHLRSSDWNDLRFGSIINVALEDVFSSD